MMAKNKVSLNDCLEQIEEMAEKTGVKLTHAEDEEKFGTTLDPQGTGAHEYLEGGKNWETILIISFKINQESNIVLKT